MDERNLKTSISVVLTTYNGENYIVEQMDSLRKQSVIADEVLIFDDCSIDNTERIIRNYISEYKLINWKIFVNDSNKGWRNNFRDAILQAKGDFIFFCDQDDIWLNNKLEIMSKAMLSNSEIDVLASAYIAFYENGGEQFGPKYFDSNSNLKKANVDIDLLNNIPPGCTYCVRKTFIEYLAPLWGNNFSHDCYVSKAATIKGSMYYFNVPLIRYRIHTDSTTAIEAINKKKKRTKKEKINYLIPSIEMLESIKSLYSNKNILALNKHILERNLKWLNLRLEFLQRNNILAGVKLLNYFSCYFRGFKGRRLIQYSLDWYLFLFG